VLCAIVKENAVEVLGSATKCGGVALHLPVCFEVYHTKSSYYDHIIGKYVHLLIYLQNLKLIGVIIDF
jgi:hypothetical protein